jgi:hypothetical protein
MPRTTATRHEITHDRTTTTMKITLAVAAVIIALIVIGVVSQSTPSQTTQSVPGTDLGTTTSDPTSAAPAVAPTIEATTAPTTEATTTDSGWADVTVTGCTTKTEFGTTMANANVRIVNHTSHPESYLITVGINNAHGDRIGEAAAVSNDLPSGRTVTVTGIGTTNEPSAPGLRCELSNVIRTP